MFSNKKLEEIFKELSSSENGLTKNGIKKNQEKYGKNILTKEKEKSLIEIILKTLLEPLTLVLIFVIFICFFLGQYKEVLVISCIIILNVIISTFQELKAKKALTALEKLSQNQALVIREGEKLELPSDELCVGDIILLQAGDFVPADIRLIETAKLLVDEAILTGEATFIEKNAEVMEEENPILGEQKNMLFSSTFIRNGRAKGIVVAVGDKTELGKISSLIQKSPDRESPLQKKLSNFARNISIFAFIFAGLIFFLSVFLNKNDLATCFIQAITLAVAIIPECLPVIVSIILALSVTKMAKNQAIIKKLPAVETLGSVDVICTDKTGTLTLNKMTVSEFFLGKGEEERELKKDGKFLLALTLCNDSFTDIKQHAIGDPTELALTYFANSYGLNELETREKYERIDELPFDSDRKIMSTVNQIAEEKIMFSKGAIDQILLSSSKIEEAGEIRLLTEEDKKEILKKAEAMSHKALRVLAFAYKKQEKEELSEDNLIFLGAVGMIDPEREEAKSAIAKAKRAGIKTVMITGDHPDTAFAIAKNLKIAREKNEVIMGKDLEKMSQENLEKAIEKYSVFSRVNPEHKVRIVQAFQASGKIVSMTGDGVNDAPSLKSADIGVAMGITGSDVAKEAASMILMDDNFQTIIYAVEEGRNIYNKIKKAVEFVLGTNFAELFGILLAVILGFVAPLGAIHVLWINLIVESLIAIPITLDKNDKSLMLEKARNKDEGIFDNMKFSLALLSLSTGLIMFLGFYLTLKSSGNLLLAQSVAFAIMANAPLLYVLSLRRKSFIFFSKIWENPYLCLAILLAFLMNLSLFYSPLNKVFSLLPLYGKDLFLAIFGIIFPTALYELYKFFKRKA